MQSQSTYRAERRTLADGTVIDVVTGPGTSPYAMVPDAKTADFLAGWMNLAHAEGKRASTRRIKDLVDACTEAHRQLATDAEKLGSSVHGRRLALLANKLFTALEGIGAKPTA